MTVFHENFLIFTIVSSGSSLSSVLDLEPSNVIDSMERIAYTVSILEGLFTKFASTFAISSDSFDGGESSDTFERSPSDELLSFETNEVATFCALLWFVISSTSELYSSSFSVILRTNLSRLECTPGSIKASSVLEPLSVSSSSFSGSVEYTTILECPVFAVIWTDNK